MTWDDLRQLRAQGLAPSFPVIVTTKSDCWTYAEIGCAVLKHEPGEPFPVELLDGLRVLLFLGDCDRASNVIRAMVAKGVKPSELSAWCQCFKRLDFQSVHCEVAQQWH